MSTAIYGEILEGVYGKACEEMPVRNPLGAFGRIREESAGVIYETILARIFEGVSGFFSE